MLVLEQRKIIWSSNRQYVAVHLFYSSSSFSFSLLTRGWTLHAYGNEVLDYLLIISHIEMHWIIYQWRLVDVRLSITMEIFKPEIYIRIYIITTTLLLSAFLSEASKRIMVEDFFFYSFFEWLTALLINKMKAISIHWLLPFFSWSS